MNLKNLGESFQDAQTVKFRLFERLFKIKKNGIFLFEISFFFLEIFTFLYYANEESVDVINSPTKFVKY